MASSRAVQAYDILRARIMDGTYGAGYRLVIDQLAREYEISSVPWREALRRLEAEGWVDIVQNAGATVKTFDTNSWHRTMRLLARLEGLATALSAPNLSPDDIATARQMNVRMREALHNLDTVQFGVLNRQFHELVCSKCDDPRLNELVMAEWVRMDLIRRSAYWYAPGRALESVDEHDGILDLIEEGASAEVIEATARDHDVKTLEAVSQYDEKLSDQRVR
jgi:DNA-binding GntR family transcriptional regulator